MLRKRASGLAVDPDTSAVRAISRGERLAHLGAEAIDTASGVLAGLAVGAIAGPVGAIAGAALGAAAGLFAAVTIEREDRRSAAHNRELDDASEPPAPRV
jgi:hypothetical protein